jgi:hypothetical protein
MFPGHLEARVLWDKGVYPKATPAPSSANKKPAARQRTKKQAEKTGGQTKRK